MQPIEILIQEISLHWKKKIFLKRNNFLKNSNTKDQNVYFVKEGCVRAKR
jgi:hypothetical protein